MPLLLPLFAQAFLEIGGVNNLSIILDTLLNEMSVKMFVGLYFVLERGFNNVYVSIYCF